MSRKNKLAARPLALLLALVLALSMFPVAVFADDPEPGQDLGDGVSVVDPEPEPEPEPAPAPIDAAVPEVPEEPQQEPAPVILEEPQQEAVNVNVQVMLTSDSPVDGAPAVSYWLNGLEVPVETGAVNGEAYAFSLPETEIGGGVRVLVGLGADVLLTGEGWQLDEASGKYFFDLGADSLIGLDGMPVFVSALLEKVAQTFSGSVTIGFNEITGATGFSLFGLRLGGTDSTTVAAEGKLDGCRVEVLGSEGQVIANGIIAGDSVVLTFEEIPVPDPQTPFTLRVYGLDQEYKFVGNEWAEFDGGWQLPIVAGDLWDFPGEGAAIPKAISFAIMLRQATVESNFNFQLSVKKNSDDSLSAYHPVKLEYYDFENDTPISGPLGGSSGWPTATRNDGFAEWTNLSRNYTYRLTVESCEAVKDAYLVLASKGQESIPFYASTDNGDGTWTYYFKIDPKSTYNVQSALVTADLKYNKTKEYLYINKSFQNVSLDGRKVYFGVQKSSDFGKSYETVNWQELTPGNLLGFLVDRFKEGQIDNDGFLTGTLTESYVVYEYCPSDMKPVGTWGPVMNESLYTSTESFRGGVGSAKEDYILYALASPRQLVYNARGDDNTVAVLNGEVDWASSMSAVVESRLDMKIIEAFRYDWLTEKVIDPEKLSLPAKGTPYPANYRVEFSRTQPDTEGKDPPVTLYIEGLQTNLAYNANLAHPSNRVEVDFEIYPMDAFRLDAENRYVLLDGTKLLDAVHHTSTLNQNDGPVDIFNPENVRKTVQAQTLSIDNFVDGQEFGILIKVRFYYNANGTQKTEVLGDMFLPLSTAGKEIPRTTDRTNITDIQLKDFVDTITLPANGLVSFDTTSGKTGIKDVKVNGVPVPAGSYTWIISGNIGTLTIPGDLAFSTADLNTVVTYTVEYLDTSWSIPCAYEYTIDNYAVAAGKDSGRSAASKDDPSKTGDEASLPVEVPAFAYLSVSKKKIDGTPNHWESGVQFALYEKDGSEPVALAQTDSSGTAVFYYPNATQTNSLASKADYDNIFKFTAGGSYRIYLPSLPDSDYPPFTASWSHTGSLDTTDLQEAFWEKDGRGYYLDIEIIEHNYEGKDQVCGPITINVEDKLNTSLTVVKEGEGVTASHFFLFRKDGAAYEPIFPAGSPTMASFTAPAPGKLFSGLKPGAYVLYEVTSVNLKPAEAGWTVNSSALPAEMLDQKYSGILTNDKTVYVKTIDLASSGNNSHVAATVTNQKTVDIKLTKSVPAGVHPERKDFTFRVYEKGKEGNAANALHFTQSGESYTFAPASNRSDDQALTISFSSLGTGAKTVTLTGLREGTYVIVEDAIDELGSIQVYEVTGNSPEATVAFGGPDKEVTITNTLKGRGTLRVEKNVVGPYDNESFHFTLLDKNGDPVNMVAAGIDRDLANTQNAQILSATAGTFTIQGGGYLTFKDIPLGAEYFVREDISGDIFTLTAIAPNGNLTTGASELITFSNGENRTVTFTNTRKDGELWVGKVVEDPSGASNSSTFTIKVTGDFWNGTAVDKNATRTFSFTSASWGEDRLQKVDGVMYGKTYTVTEDDPGSLYGVSIQADDGEFVPGRSAAVTITGESARHQVLVKNERGKFSVTLNKEVGQNQKWPNEGFTFALYQKDGETWTLVTEEQVTDGSRTASWTGLTSGLEYRVYEVSGNATFKNVSGWSTSELAADYPAQGVPVGSYYQDINSNGGTSVPLNVTNRLTELRVTKESTGSQQEGFTFYVQGENGKVGFTKLADGDYTYPGSVTDIEIAHDQTISFYGLPYGEYQVVEDPVPAGYTVSYQGKVGETGGTFTLAEETVDTPAQIKILNSVNRRKVTLTKSVDGDNADASSPYWPGSGSPFRFSLWVRNASGSYVPINGKFADVGQGNRTAAFADLDEDLSYRIYETNNNGFVPYTDGEPWTWDNVNNGYYYDIDLADTTEDLAVAVDNAPTELTVSKAFPEGVDGDTARTFEFKVLNSEKQPMALTRLTGSNHFKYDPNGLLTSATVNVGAQATIYGLPLGSYTVEELDGGQRYTIAYDYSDGTGVTFSRTDLEGEAAITNDPRKLNISLEKDVNNTAWPESGFTFHLYRKSHADGAVFEAVPGGDRTAVAGTATVTWENLPADFQYRIYEEAYSTYVPAGWSGPETIDGVSAYYKDVTPVRNGEGYVINLTGAASKVVNTPTTLIVNKELTGTPAQDFTFTVYDGDVPVPVSPTAEANKYVYDENGSTDPISVTPGTSVSIYGLPTGTAYTVRETDEEDNGFDVSYTGQTFTFSASNRSHTATIRNALKTVSLTVNKAVLGINGEQTVIWPANGFDFTLYWDKNKDGEFVPYDGSGTGTPTQTVSSGSSSAGWSNLEHGYEYRIYEMNPTGYAPSLRTPGVNNGVDWAADGEGHYYLAVDPAKTAGASNSYAGVFNTDNRITKLTVSKFLADKDRTDSNQYDDFTFQVLDADNTPLEFRQDGGSYVYTTTKAATTRNRFDIRHNGTIVFYGLPEGTYTVVETGTGGYDVRYTVNSNPAETAAVTMTPGEQQDVVMVNGTDTFQLGVSKSVGEVGGQTLWSDFTFGLYRNDGGSWTQIGDEIILNAGTPSDGWDDQLLYGYEYRIYESGSGYAATADGWVKADEDDPRGDFYYPIGTIEGDAIKGVVIPNTVNTIPAVNDPTMLTVGKEIAEGSLGDGETFTFNVLDEENTPVSVIETDGYYVPSTAEESITAIPVAAGETVQVYRLPFGRYTVAEIDADDYSVTYTNGGTFTVTEEDSEAEVVMTNAYKTTGFQLTKQVDEGAWPADGFQAALYRLVPGATEDDSDTWEKVEPTTGDGTLTEDQPAMEWSELPLNRTYRFYETDPQGFLPNGWTAGTDPDGEPAYYYEPTGLEGEIVEVALDNDPTTLIVDKELLTGDKPEGVEFKFRIASPAEEEGEAAILGFTPISGNQYLYDPEGEIEEFTIEPGTDNAYTFYGIPLGLNVFVEESETAGFKAGYQVGEAQSEQPITLSFTDEDLRAETTIRNDVDTTRLTVEKKIEDKAGRTITEQFPVAVKINGAEGPYLAFDPDPDNANTYLYREEVGAFDEARILLSVDTAVTFLGLPYRPDGEYILVEPEEEMPEGFEPDTAKGIDPVNFRLEQDGDDLIWAAEANVYNAIDYPDDGSLTVSKKIADTSRTDSSDIFVLRVSGEFHNGDGTTTDTHKDYTFAKNGATNAYAYNEAVPVQGVIAGNRYTVTELDGGTPVANGGSLMNGKYSVSYTLGEAEATADGAAAAALEVTNTPITFDLLVSKQIVGAVQKSSFPLFIRRVSDGANVIFAYDGASNSYKYLGERASSAYNSSVDAVSIHNGATTLLTGLPNNLRIQLDEDVSGTSYTPTYTVDGVTGNMITIGTGSTGTQHNARIVNQSATELTIQKWVQSGNGAVAGRAFTFQISKGGVLVPVQLVNGNYIYDPTGSNYNINVGTYSTSERGYVAYGSVNITGLPFDNGTPYTIQEVGLTDNYYLRSQDGNTFYLRNDANYYNTHTASFTNYRRSTTTGGGGGSNPDPDPDPDPSPRVGIPDDTVPLSTIFDGDTPLATLLDQPVPLAGGIAVGVILGAAGIGLIGSGLAMKRRQRRKDSQDSSPHSDSDSGTES